MSGMDPPKGKRGTLRRGSQGNRDSCDLSFHIDLMGVRASALRNVRIGDLLEIKIHREHDFRAVVCENRDGERIGALAAFPGLVTLIECLNQGVKYLARVERSSEQSCTVYVHRVDA